MSPSTHHRADIVIVGAGIAGLSAASAAQAAGASVLVLERSDQLGGNAPISTGYFCLVDTEAQRAAGHQDSVEQFIEDFLAQIERDRDTYATVHHEDLARRFAEESGAAYEFLRELGLEFDKIIPRPLQHTVPRLLAVERTEAIREALARIDVPIHYATRARRLIVEDGRVIGLHAQTDGGETVEYRADRAVILAAGGYQGGVELRRRLQEGDWAEAPFAGLTTCTGDGHLMADAVGGDLINMPMVPRIVRVASILLEDCIAVSPDGRRFHNEPGPYAYRLERLKEIGGLGYYIADGVTLESRREFVDQQPEPPLTADTLEELAAGIGVPPAALTETVERWNDFLATDAHEDPDFERVILPSGRRPIVQPPFAALRMIPGVGSSVGGLATDTDLRVVDVFGSTIPGLYAAGDCAGGVTVAKGLGGVHLGAGVTLGLAAGRAAAEDS